MRTASCAYPNCNTYYKLALQARGLDAALELVDALAGLGARDDDVLRGHVELLADGGELLVLLVAAELVRLRKRHHEGELALLQKLDHLVVESARVVTDVDERDDEVEAALEVEEIADELRPAVALGLGAAREAVSGQVDEVHAVRLEEVHVARLARRARDLHQALAAEQLVHDGGLTHVRAADETHLRAGGRRDLRCLAVARHEVCALVVDGIGHDGSPIK